MIELISSQDLVDLDSGTPEGLRASRFIEGANLHLGEYINTGNEMHAEVHSDIGLIVLRNILKPVVVDQLLTLVGTLDYEDCTGGHMVADKFPVNESPIATQFVNASIHGWGAVEPVFNVNRYDSSNKSPTPHVDFRTRVPVILMASNNDGGVKVHPNLAPTGRLPYFKQIRDFKKGLVQTIEYGKNDVLIMDGVRRLHHGFRGIDAPDDESRLTFVDYLYTRTYKLESD